MAQFEMNGTELKKCKLDRGEMEVVIPDGVTKIAGRLFKGRKTIVKVTLPESLTEIGEQAFMDCISLESCNLPESLQIVGQNAFAGCTALTGIVCGCAVIGIVYRLIDGRSCIDSIRYPLAE